MSLLKCESEKDYDDLIDLLISMEWLSKQFLSAC